MRLRLLVQMPERMTTEALVAKIEWEGGILPLLEYGIEPEEVPIELERSWKDLRDAFIEYQAQEILMERRLENG